MTTGAQRCIGQEAESKMLVLTSDDRGVGLCLAVVLADLSVYGQEGIESQILIPASHDQSTPPLMRHLHKANMDTNVF